MNIIEKEKALDYLRSGKIIIFPTETSYGLGCDATNQQAVDKIFKIKGRRGDKPLLVIVPTIEMAKEYLEWNDLLEKIATKYWFTRRSPSEGGPGPLTVVGMSLRGSRFASADEAIPMGSPHPLLRGVRDDRLASGVVSKDKTIAVRVTNAEIPKYLSEQLGRPVVATSANLADLGDVYSGEELIKMYEGREIQPDAIINAGILPSNPPTTIVSVVGGELKVLRQGEVKVV
ncbi:MAG: Bifunctional N5-glutamine S-adenosyl-L-methionine-dependent methyltransferase/tRNA (M7G46) methyltransferase [Candidatus Magasanikbacteria bacterium GW2011_GWC2_37_14]|uniref:L-threonylcarbamoyladenylate synthase n=1 Tax=Candidatus Magasanikbacteria bacterium GW2011_GWC2_37_14 TaxID=1619046 RepID=A0A0G0JIR5_9BACT|nr:MAG: Bifunctional N5-glutamine S-adenosyl-L-methionine-dependent methyltransferase/tRNA (M7G46) methyltransferase [Candidatus Magasanikbacteria bacterium GW2011_GWC2_37_14]